MRRALLLLSLAALAAGQDDGGRDTGDGPRPVIFVRARRTTESGEIYNAAWRGLEQHFGALSRRRLADFDGDPKRAAAYFSENTDCVMIVAFGREVVPFLPGGRLVLRVGEEESDHICARTDRGRLAQVMRLFRPGARRVALFDAGAGDEALPGLEVVPCSRPADAAGCDLAWIREGSRRDPRALRAALDSMGIPLVGTRGDLDPGDVALSVRPDPDGLGLQLAAMMLRWARTSEPFRRVAVQRQRIVIDLVAARAAKYEVPLAALARADVVRRER